MGVIPTATKKKKATVVKKGDHHPEWCPVTATISLIGKKYMLLIIHELQGGTKRFGELQKAVTGISTKTLSERLQELEDDGLITRKVYPVVPLKVEYSLTKKGTSLKDVLWSLREWGNKHA